MYYWSNLKKTQDLKIFQSMYVWLLIVPIFAKLFEHIRESTTIVLFSSTFTISLTLPFSWKVFYFSSLCIVFANVLYQVFCPTIIKDHVNYSHFKAEGKGVRQLEKYASLTGFDIKTYQLIEKSQATISPYGGNAALEKENEEMLQKLFWSIHEYASELHKTARVICSIFLFLGLLLIGWVLFENMRWVFRAILHT